MEAQARNGSVGDFRSLSRGWPGHCSAKQEAFWNLPIKGVLIGASDKDSAGAQQSSGSPKQVGRQLQAPVLILHVGTVSVRGHRPNPFSDN